MWNTWGTKMYMRSFTYLAIGILIISAVCIGTGVGLGISGLVIGGVLCLAVGAMVGVLGGATQRR